jgi:hypothetical protein
VRRLARWHDGKLPLTDDRWWPKSASSGLPLLTAVQGREKPGRPYGNTLRDRG